MAKSSATFEYRRTVATVDVPATLRLCLMGDGSIVWEVYADGDMLGDGRLSPDNRVDWHAWAYGQIHNGQ